VLGRIIRITEREGIITIEDNLVYVYRSLGVLGTGRKTSTNILRATIITNSKADGLIHNLLTRAHAHAHTDITASS